MSIVALSSSDRARGGIALTLGVIAMGLTTFALALMPVLPKSNDPLQRLVVATARARPERVPGVVLLLDPVAEDASRLLLRAGDVITHVDGVPTPTLAQFHEVVTTLSTRGARTVSGQRRGQPFHAAARLGQ